MQEYSYVKFYLAFHNLLSYNEFKFQVLQNCVCQPLIKCNYTNLKFHCTSHDWEIEFCHLKLQLVDM